MPYRHLVNTFSQPARVLPRAPQARLACGQGEGHRQPRLSGQGQFSAAQLSGNPATCICKDGRGTFVWQTPVSISSSACCQLHLYLHHFSRISPPFHQQPGVHLRLQPGLPPLSSADGAEAPFTEPRTKYWLVPCCKMPLFGPVPPRHVLFLAVAALLLNLFVGLSWFSDAPGLYALARGHASPFSILAEWANSVPPDRPWLTAS